MKVILKSLNLSLKLIGVLGLALLAAYAQDAPKQDTHGIVVGNMDSSVKPGDNFFLYCNGEWIKRTEIPPDRSRIGVFTTLADLSDKRTAALIEEAAKSGGLAGSRRAKSPISTTPTWTRPPSRPRGLRLSSRTSKRSPPSATRNSWPLR